ncbi:dihydroneopterin aldolase [Alphaproteobacteria bacterium]|jgi:7,8-dihydroneopterin aldolase/epimerase/oxygenase|nr:dihydroneopterin aldolase [Alphaproteobacteria bacterium]MBT5799118.1 dihydroneopterin aldolase [Alphaproteobacteria bacterium]MDA9190647.1 dihydroneopterin aldolase [Alphaproteobacteria bacterium]MDC0394236.1 dihydroneopterin aldolase [Alphaproteobacteria bacterium]
MPNSLKRHFQLYGIEVICSIGIHSFEREKPQRILIDLDVHLDPYNEPNADNIAEALDYDTVRSAVLDLSKSRHFDLQETLARQIFDLVQKMPSVIGVSVRTCKPDVYADIREAAYILSNC